ncbi:hypothetical protein TWF696_007041 [Orbilia brochopaga]|uniref:JmjC domain-containing protein n=1 Tax=Orbilia brochopaga TaxID=3140254 RepID=A0AAV9UU15_9PEZI
MAASRRKKAAQPTVSTRSSRRKRAATPEPTADSPPPSVAGPAPTDSKYVQAIPMAPSPAHKFIQRMTCQSLRKNGSDIIQCQSCIERRNDSGGCRFAGFRAFKLIKPDDEDEKRSVETPPPSSEVSGSPNRASEHRTQKKRRLNNYPPLPPGLDYQNYVLIGDRTRHGPTQKDPSCLMSTGVALGQSPKTLSADDEYIMSKIAAVLHKGIQRGLTHESQSCHPNLTHPIIRIAEDPAQRSLCDACATTLFIISYVCHICGREYCPDCYDDWEHQSENIRFETCSRNRMHKKQQMLLTVRACEGELKTISQELERYVKKVEESAEVQVEDRLKYKTRSLRNEIFAPVYEFSADEFEEQSFKNIWGLHGRPIVIKDCYERFKLPWDPEYFINNHGHEDCTLVQTCPPFNDYHTKVAKFFEQFGQEHRTEALKLKDWPPTDNFADVFPELMVDFERALPDAVAKHVRHDGIYNLASRFPDGYNKPDLGPKMYNAFPATVQMDGKPGGTTNLHRDITDAINFMMYATSAADDAEIDDDAEDGDRSPGAIWDIFPIGATAHIRDYLDSQFPNQPTDPFHRQNCYLTMEDLETLHSLYGVQSYRILQRPGDAIMIPAGCAHQVRNIKDCIKVAVDFLSPESAEICEYLLHENRAIAERANSALLTKKGKETKKMSRVRKEDVLQLWKCLMFYYTAVREQIWGVTDANGEENSGESRGESESKTDVEVAANQAVLEVREAIQVD